MFKVVFPILAEFWYFADLKTTDLWPIAVSLYFEASNVTALNYSLKIFCSKWHEAPLFTILYKINNEEILRRLMGPEERVCLQKKPLLNHRARTKS